MMLFIFLIILTLVLGFLIVSAIWSSDPSWRAWLLRFFLGIGPGVGVITALFFLNRALGLELGEKSFLLIITLLVLFSSLVVILRMRGKPKLVFDLPRLSIRWIWIIILGLSVIVFVNSFMADVLTFPDGDWDAWAIWNMHARFMAQAGEAWMRMFDPALNATHPDYPLLTPIYIALGWITFGRFTSIVPIFMALLFTLGTVGLLFSALNYQRKFLGASLASIVLLFSGALLNYSSNLYADIPLAFEILAATIVLYLWVWKRQAPFLILLGLFCGLATWTKNEGWSLLVAVVIVLGIYSWLERDPIRAVLKHFGLFIGGLSPLLLVSLYHKIVLVPANDIFLARSLGDILQFLLSPARWGYILKRVLDGVTLFDNRIFIILLFFGLVIGIVKRTRREVRNGWLVLLIIAAQYLVIYAITPQDLAWHIDTSLERLVTQMFPAILFLIFTSLNLSEKSPSSQVT